MVDINVDSLMKQEGWLIVCQSTFFMKDALWVSCFFCCDLFKIFADILVVKSLDIIAVKRFLSVSYVVNSEYNVSIALNCARKRVNVFNVDVGSAENLKNIVKRVALLVFSYFWLLPYLCRKLLAMEYISKVVEMNSASPWVFYVFGFVVSWFCRTFANRQIGI